LDGVSYVQLNTASISAASITSHQSGPARSHPALGGAAAALGMTLSDLRTAYQSGQSLSAIASSKGMSQDALVAAMASAIQQANPSFSADQASQVATAIATRTPPAGSAFGVGATAPGGLTQATGATAAAATAPAGGHHHHHHHAMSTAVGAVASLLGTTTTDLATSLQSGQSLASIASSKGVSQNALVGAISTALQGADSSLSADQAAQLATTLATGRPPTNQQSPWATATAGPSSTFTVAA
jgi:hypothetical protein